MTTTKPIPAVTELNRIADIITQRDLTHGDAGTNFTEMARRWSAYLGIKLSPADAAAMMVDAKMSRMCSGGMGDQHLEDIAGYAALALTLPKEPVGEDKRKHLHADHPPEFVTTTKATWPQYTREACDTHVRIKEDPELVPTRPPVTKAVRDAELTRLETTMREMREMGRARTNPVPDFLAAEIDRIAGVPVAGNAVMSGGISEADIAASNAKSAAARSAQRTPAEIHARIKEDVEREIDAERDARRDSETETERSLRASHVSLFQPPRST